MNKKKKTITGKVSHVDLEGGYYCLTTSSGEIFKLDGGGADLRKAGVHAEVEGTPLNLVALAGAEPEALLQRGAVTIRGDVELAQRYRELALLLRPDFEEELSRLVGDAPAHQLMRFASGALAFGRRAFSTTAQNLAEYAAHERGDLVPRAEAEVFLAGVDRLREDVDRCAARLEHLEQRLAATAALRDGAGAGAGVQPDAGPAGGGRAHHDASRGPR